MLPDDGVFQTNNEKPHIRISVLARAYRKHQWHETYITNWRRPPPLLPPSKTCATYSINWLVFITEMKCLQRGTDWVF